MADGQFGKNVDISAFVNNFGAAGARPSLYKVEITAPEKLEGVTKEGFQKVSFLCKNAQLPGSTIGEIPVNFLGRQVKMPGIRTYENLTLSFYNDEDFGIRHEIETWMHQIQSFGKPFGNIVNLADSSGGQSSTTIKVIQLSKAGEDLRAYDFYYAFPTTCSAIDLGFDQAEAIEEFSVTFAYSYFDVSGGDGAGANSKGIKDAS
jgi:hypothetical protein